LGGSRYTWFCCTSILSSACWTGISECLDNSSSITLLKSGDKCWTTTNAIPGLGGRLAKNCSSDSRPPAEAPIPTTLNFDGCSAADIEAEADSGATYQAPLLQFHMMLGSPEILANEKPFSCC